MHAVTELENTSLLRAVADSTAAKEALAKTEPSPSLFITVVIVACVAGTIALGAARPEPIFLPIIGGVSGAALALGALGVGEARRLRRRLDAILVLSRANKA